MNKKIEKTLMILSLIIVLGGTVYASATTVSNTFSKFFGRTDFEGEVNFNNSLERVNEIRFAMNASDIQTKLDECSDNCIVVMPKGTLTLTDTINITGDGKTLMGQGRYATQLYAPNGKDAIYIHEDGEYTSQNKLENFKILLQSSHTSPNAIHLNRTKLARIKDITIIGNFTNAGIYMEDWARYNYVDGVHMEIRDGVGIKIDGSATVCANNMIMNSIVTAYDNPALYIGENTQSSMIMNNKFLSINSTVVIVGEAGGENEYKHQIANNNIEFYGTTATYTGVLIIDNINSIFAENIINTQGSELLAVGINISNNDYLEVNNNQFEGVTLEYDFNDDYTQGSTSPFYLYDDYFIINNAPTLYIRENDQAADAKTLGFISENGELILRAYNDAFANQGSRIKMSRAGEFWTYGTYGQTTKALCIKADGYFGTCTDAVDAAGSCTCI